MSDEPIDASEPTDAEAPSTPPATPPVAEDAAHTMLARARASARDAGAPSGSSRSGPARARRTTPTRSGSAPDGRDPQTAGRVLTAWLRDRGFEESVAAGGLEAHWEAIAGPEIAAHVSCETSQGPQGRVILLRADSTAWATQIRLLLPQVTRRIEQVLGRPVTDPIRVLGPVPPRRSPGPRRVPGRGPRDTYG